MRMAIYTAWDMERINSEYEPKLDLKIARYISYKKLESMLSSNTLFFCNAFNFEDKYEGEIPSTFFEGWSNESAENYRQFNILKNNVYVPYVSCWTPYQPGNKKMWEEYAGEDGNKDGVCIIEKLKEMLEEYLKKTEPEYYPPVENLLDLIYEHYTENNPVEKNTVAGKAAKAKEKELEEWLRGLDGMDRLVDDYVGDKIPLWEKIMDRQGSVCCAWEKTAFEEGLKVGIRLMMEVCGM